MKKRAGMVMKGFKEMRAALDALPTDLTVAAHAIVGSHAYAAATQILAGYAAHEDTGALADGLTVEEIHASGRFLAIARVVNRAPHAYIFELGTVARYTKSGAYRGVMPPGNIFYPITDRERDAMYDDIAALLVDFGLTVQRAA